MGKTIRSRGRLPIDTSAPRQRTTLAGWRRSIRLSTWLPIGIARVSFKRQCGAGPWKSAYEVGLVLAELELHLNSADCADFAKGYWLRGECARPHGLYHAGKGYNCQGRIRWGVAVNDEGRLPLRVDAFRQVRPEVSELFGLRGESAE